MVLRRLWSLLAAMLSVALAAAVLVLFPGVVGWHVFAVPSGSMERTLPIGSYIATEPADRPRRGNVVVWREPGTASSDGASRTFVKRVIAVGGDTIQCCDPSGAVVVNRRSLHESYLFDDDRQRFGPVQVPPRRLFIMGDHRAYSADSRARITDHFHGTVGEDAVVGVAIGPLSRTAAHREPVRHFLPHLLALAFIVGLGTEIALRGVRPQDLSESTAQRSAA